MNALDTLKFLSLFCFVMTIIASFLFKDERKEIIVYGSANVAITFFTGYIILKELLKVLS